MEVVLIMGIDPNYKIYLSYPSQKSYFPKASEKTHARIFGWNQLFP